MSESRKLLELMDNSHQENLNYLEDRFKEIPNGKINIINKSISFDLDGLSSEERNLFVSAAKKVWKDND